MPGVSISGNLKLGILKLRHAEGRALCKMNCEHCEVNSESTSKSCWCFGSAVELLHICTSQTKSFAKVK